MNKIIVILIIALLAFPAYSQVNGDTLRIDGKLVLKMWGTHYERGYALGYLQGDEIKSLYDNYIVNYCFQGSAAQYNYVFNFYTQNFQVEAKYVDEVEGMFDGMIAAGVSLYSSVIGRDYTPTDGMMVNALADLSGLAFLGLNTRMGCSTISSWGASTIADPQLFGSLVITRAFDWDMQPTLLSNHIIMVNLPSETDEVPWINLGFPGLVAPFSAISEDGIAAFQNVGNYNNQTQPGPYHPISFSLRNGLESADYNGDSQHTPADVIAAIANETSLSSWILTVTDSYDGKIIECNNALGSIVRTEANNNIAPVVQPNNIVATNHHRLLYNPIACYRYSNIADSLRNNSSINVERSWNIIRGGANLGWNVHMVQFAPALDLLKYATAPNASTPAWSQEPTVFTFSELFEPPSSVESEGKFTVLQEFCLNAYPNPFNPSTQITFNIAAAGMISLKVYNLQGSETAILFQGYAEKGFKQYDFNAYNISSGIYFIKLETSSGADTRKIMLLK